MRALVNHLTPEQQSALRDLLLIVTAVATHMALVEFIGGGLERLHRRYRTRGDT